jgi:hypothetical protein
MKASDSTMAATLMIVAVMASRIMNREKEGSLFRAMRRAMKRGVFNTS